MKLLKVSFDGLNMFKDGKLTLDFFATDRVVDQRGVTCIEKPIYSENIMAFAGINATGKTTTLRLIALAVNLLSGGSVAVPMQDPCFSSTVSEHLKIDVSSPTTGRSIALSRLSTRTKEARSPNRLLCLRFYGRSVV